MNEVAITGIGMVTPLGVGREKTWAALTASASAVTTSKLYPGILTASVEGLPFPPELRLLSMGFLAAAEAVDDARLNLHGIAAQRIGCTVSASKPNLAASDESAIPFNEAYYQGAVGEQLYRILKLRGPIRSISAACSTGTHSIILAAQWIREGLCDVVIAGAAESSLHPLYLAGFSKMGVLAKDQVRPFDTHRQGFAIGEGAGIVIVENKHHALMRGAKVYGILNGWAMANDIHMACTFSPDGQSIAGAITSVLKMSSQATVDYINAHGTATTHNDRAESLAIRQAFGHEAGGIAVSSTKAATGHLLGASGAVELGISLLALRDNTIPPTLNLNFPDPDCDLDYTPHLSRRRSISSIMSLSFGFGGQIGALAARRL
jgi:3-oxoacyl-[acyl-carrier-protein] synthase II